MNILPKKRWHVRNQDNKERVRKDEENARLEQKREEERIALAEQEARLTLLRRKSGEKSLPVNCESQHFSLFAAEEEAGNAVKKDNVEYVKEKQDEKEKYEKKIGLLTYVGQSSAEAKGKDGQPWYLEQKLNKKCSDSSDSEKDESKKSRLDPLYEVEKHLKTKKDKKKKKKKKKNREDSPKRIKSSSKSTLEELREKRLRREKVERDRANQLLRKDSPPDDSKSKPESDPTRYSNHFFPDLARKRRHERY